MLAMLSPAMNVGDALDNWARWCRRVWDCYPGCATNWDLIPQVEYKNCHLTTQEKLEEALEHQEPNELQAMQVERLVNALASPQRAALRVHWVLMPEAQRHGMNLTIEQWDERRARFATRRAGWYFNPLTYREAVDAAMNAIEDCL